MPTPKLFWNILWRATACGVIIALTVQAIFGALLVVFGFMAAATNRGAELLTPENAVATLGGIFILWLIGAVGGGLFSIPAGIFVGATGGILMSIITRIFFYPLKNARRYRIVIGIAMGVYALVVSWLCFIAIYLLFARDNTIQSPFVPWLALIPALIAGALGYFVSGWIARWYGKAANGLKSG